MESNQSQCRMQPNVWFLMGTLLFTSVATAMLCVAIMTDHWEQVTWDRRKLDAIAVRQKNGTQVKWVLEWLLDGQVGRIVFTNDEGLRKVPEMKDQVTSVDSSGQEHDEEAVFLIPMHGGIWTMCVSLNEQQRQLLLKAGFTQIRCINYLDPDTTKCEEGRTDWQHRMQNLSISCALVCLIILGSSALVGVIGVLKHQISAVLVTGVIYLLAATFAIFTLTIIHFKRQQKPEKTAADTLLVGGGMSTLIDGVSLSRSADAGHVQVDSDVFTARVFNTSWSLDLGWGGVTLCVLTSILWILLSKIMRYSPLSTIFA